MTLRCDENSNERDETRNQNGKQKGRKPTLRDKALILTFVIP